MFTIPATASLMSVHVFFLADSWVGAILPRILLQVLLSWCLHHMAAHVAYTVSRG